MAYLQLSNIEKYFGDHHAIKGVDLQIEKGEFVVFVGPSGCGKSTLLRMIAGLETIDKGSLQLDKRDITALPSSKRDLAMVFQSYALYPHMTVFENMSFALKLAGVDRAVIREKVDKAAAILDLAKYLERTPKELSGGQRQRVAIGRAIVRDPKVFLFDEPLSNLDAALRVQTRIEIAKLHRDLGATSIYVTHDQVEAMTLADRVVVLRDGQIEQHGAPLDLYDRPANRFVAQFIGTPSMNVVPATTLPQLAALAGAAAHADGFVGIRPEHVHLARCRTKTGWRRRSSWSNRWAWRRWSTRAWKTMRRSSCAAASVATCSRATAPSCVSTAAASITSIVPVKLMRLPQERQCHESHQIESGRTWPLARRRGGSGLRARQGRPQHRPHRRRRILSLAPGGVPGPAAAYAGP